MDEFRCRRGGFVLPVNAFDDVAAYSRPTPLPVFLGALAEHRRDKRPRRRPGSSDCSTASRRIKSSDYSKFFAQGQVRKISRVAVVVFEDESTFQISAVGPLTDVTYYTLEKGPWSNKHVSFSIASVVRDVVDADGRARGTETCDSLVMRLSTFDLVGPNAPVDACKISEFLTGSNLTTTAALIRGKRRGVHTQHAIYATIAHALSGFYYYVDTPYFRNSHSSAIEDALPSASVGGAPDPITVQNGLSVLSESAQHLPFVMMTRSGEPRLMRNTENKFSISGPDDSGLRTTRVTFHWKGLMSCLFTSTLSNHSLSGNEGGTDSCRTRVETTGEDLVLRTPIPEQTFCGTDTWVCSLYLPTISVLTGGKTVAVRKPRAGPPVYSADSKRPATARRIPRDPAPKPKKGSTLGEWLVPTHKAAPTIEPIAEEAENGWKIETYTTCVDGQYFRVTSHIAPRARLWVDQESDYEEEVLLPGKPIGKAEQREQEKQQAKATAKPRRRG